MRASAGADRPSLLAVSPRNQELSAGRRVRLLAAFGSLDEDTRADFLEAAETMAFRAGGGVDFQRDELRRIIRQVHAAAGWENES